MKNTTPVKPTIKKSTCPFCGKKYLPESTDTLFCPECIAQNELDVEKAIRCTICNGLYLPEMPGETICPECFDDIAQANQPTQSFNTLKP